MTGLHFLVPGRLDQITGGYLFDRRIVEGLRRLGRAVTVHELAGDFANVDDAARRAAAASLAGMPDGAAAALDGLALPGFQDALPAACRRLRLVAFVHHPLALETGVAPDRAARLAALERRLLPLFRGAICPSARTADSCVEYGVPPGRVAVVPPGVEKSRTEGPAAPARRPGAEWRLLCVGTLTPRKGHAVLVRALAAVADLPWRLLCLGSLERDPATAAAVRREIAAQGLESRVVLAGERPPERLPAAYREADLFVLPSFHEGYGMAYAEAMAHGLPVVGTTGGAIPDTVPHEAGLLVPPGDVPALTAALRRLMTEPALYDRLAAGARRVGGTMPGWDETVRTWATAFDRLTG